MRVIDVGMYDGADTRYYLERGHKVLAIEANPALCAAVSEQLNEYVQSGQLQVLNVAVSNDGEDVELTVTCQDLGASSIFADRVAHRYPIGSYRVAARSFGDILRQYGPADFIKIDIEGADRDCIMALSPDNAPTYLSFEASLDITDQLHHLDKIGFRHFKFIQQTSFRSLDRQHLLTDRIIRKAFQFCGYREPQYVKRNGRFFKLIHSAGPPPWESDGSWLSLERALLQWTSARKESWYDVHATKG